MVGVGGGLRWLNVLGLDLAWSDVDRGELREGYDVSISMSMSRSANLEKERGERGQSAGNKRLRAVRLRERAAARSRRPVRRDALAESVLTVESHMPSPAAAVVGDIASAEFAAV